MLAFAPKGDKVCDKLCFVKILDFSGRCSVLVPANRFMNIGDDPTDVLDHNFKSLVGLAFQVTGICVVENLLVGFFDWFFEGIPGSNQPIGEPFVHK